jgi:ribosome biogenesis GTPase
MELSELGWDPAWEAAFAPFAADGFLPARAVTEDKHYYTLVCTEGPVLGQIAGKLIHRRQHNAALPKVGDWVAFRRPPASDRVSIEAILPRRSSLSRKIPGREASGQVLAANVDVALVVQALDETLNFRRIERFLVTALEGGARPVILLNKSDLHPDPDSIAEQVRSLAGQHPVLVTSARTGRAIPRIREFIPASSTAVVLGTSGVGKSSLVNRLYGERVQPTLPVRDSDSKGRHATTTRELILLPGGGLIIDTPGLRELHLWLSETGLADSFPDIVQIAATCRFRDCRHESEAGCAVRQHASDGRLDPDRLQSFLKLQRELQSVAHRHREHQWAVNRRRVRSGTRAHLLDDSAEDE